MADDGKHHSKSKMFSRERWRSRSNADETKSNPDMDQNVADFLKPSNSTRSRPVIPLAPRIDVAAAQRWAGNSADLKSGNGIMTPSSLRGRGGSQKGPRRPGLTVNFSVLPDVIGEGGEECELPTVEISRRLRRQTNPAPNNSIPTRSHTERHVERPSPRRNRTPPPTTRSQTLDTGDLHPGFGDNQNNYNDVEAAYRQLVGDDFDNLPPPHDEPPPQTKDSFEAPKLQRAPTGFRMRGESVSSSYSDDRESVGPSPAVSKQPPSSNPFQLPAFNSVMDDSPLDLTPLSTRDSYHNESDLTSPIVQNKIHKMRQEEGRMLHQNARRSIIELAEEQVPLTVPPPQPAPISTAVPPSVGAGFKAWSPVQTQNQFPNAAAPASKPRAPPSSQAPYLSAAQQISTPSSIASNATPDSHQRNPSIRKPVPSPANLTTTTEASQPAYSQQSYQANPTRPSPTTLNTTQPAYQPNARPTPSPLSIPSAKENASFSATDPLSSKSTRSHYSDSRTPATATSLKTPVSSASSAISQAALEDFAERCAHMRGIFRLQAEFEKPMSEYTHTQWLRAAAWWFIRGRAGMEAIIRGRPRSSEGQNAGFGRTPEQRLTQPHVDLAKCWWIMAEIIPVHKALPPAHESVAFGARAMAAAAANDNNSAEFFNGCDILYSNLKALLGSMARNKVMPPNNALIQGQDQTIWIKYPVFASDLLPILSGRKSRSLTESAAAKVFQPLTVMAVADTTSDFTYYRWFIKATLGTDDDQSERVSLLCLCSVMRTRNDWHPKVAICTQKELITICITGNKENGPSWEDVKWSSQDCSLQIRLPHGYMLNAQLEQADFRLLETMYKQAFAVQTSLFPLADEHIAFEVPLQDFQYSDSMRPPAFPLERVRRCRVRIFAKTEKRTEGTGQRRFYRGMRLLVVTSPKGKQLASVSHEVGMNYPICVEMLTETAGGDSFPAMAAHIKEEHRQSTLFMVFNQLKDRQMLYSALNQIEPGPEECQFASVRLKKLSIEPSAEAESFSRAAQNPLGRMQWQEVVVLNKDPENPEHDVGQTVLSDNLRIVSQGVGGVVTDRINLGPGELKFRLTSDGTPSIIILRHAQDDLTLTFDRRAAPFTPDQVEDLHRTIVSQTTKRTYSFFNPQELHMFQKAITGFSVRFDDLAATFTISRRRPVTALSKHKKLEAGLTRLQVVSHDRDRVVQLLAFFDAEVTWADSIGFVLKGVDFFERFESKHATKGRFGVRIVDAKFALPRERAKSGNFGQDELERPYICVDMPEYPGENDDIWIGFDEEEERERFLAALPAPATTMSRGMTLKAWKP